MTKNIINRDEIEAFFRDVTHFVRGAFEGERDDLTGEMLLKMQSTAFDKGHKVTIRDLEGFLYGTHLPGLIPPLMIDDEPVEITIERPELDIPINKYAREIKPGVFVDVYDVLAAWGVECPAIQHAIKKQLQPGARGNKSRRQDIEEAAASLHRALELPFVGK